MHGSNHPKQAHSHPQRRHRFHNPHQPNPQRRHPFHQRPPTQPISPPQGPTQPGMKPVTPLHGGRHSRLKPVTPMHGGWHSRLKPVTPMHGSNHPKQAHSHPQRRPRFHQRPPNTTDLTTTRRHTARRETHSTTARRLALALETRDTTARLQPPKTGPFTPAKATPVSRTADKHNRRHRPQAADSHHRDLSTGEMLNASYPQGHNSSFSSHSRRAIIHQSGPYPQLHMVVSNCYLNSSHPSDRRFALLALMERKYNYIASERTATF